MSLSGKTFLHTAPWLALLPEGVWFDVQAENRVEFQRYNLSISETREAISKAFGLTEPWRKQYNELCSWWEYLNRTSNGIVLKLFADKEGPASCRKIVEIVSVEENVPVAFEKRMVEKQIIRWECDE